MKITKDIVKKVVFEYGYDEYAKVIAHKNNSIEIKFEANEPQMDLIYAISGIVQDILVASGIEMGYEEYPWVNTTNKHISVIFREEDFKNA